MYSRREEHDLSDTQLEESYWLVSHWKSIEQHVVKVLIIFDIVLGLVVLGFVVKLYVFDYSGTKHLISSLKEQFATKSQEVSVAPLLLSAPIVIRNGTGYDLAVEVSNQNADWQAKGSLLATINGVAQQIPFIVYPNETVTVAKLGVQGMGIPLVSVAQGEVAWNRLSGNDKDQIELKRRFKTSEYQLAATTDPGVPTKLRFTLENGSAYNFWEVPLSIVALLNGQISAVNQLTISNVEAGEKRHVEAPWFNQVPLGDTYRVFTQLDIFDSTIFRSSKPVRQKL